ncbi:MAG TPA: hypothetical protein VEJ46_03430 [Candidatus Acidoferrum sp.]|nr:hypothetical protein [Candidatus Acidoferrum sp.]
MRALRSLVAVLSFLVSTALASGQTVSSRDGFALPAVGVSPAIVIGFLGGFVGHDNAVHGGVKLAAHLREVYPAGVYVQVYENRRGKQAYEQILQLLDADHDGTLSPEEKRHARIVLYGHSWGASETVNVARKLEKNGIPVLLTVQVDSVRKPGENDSVIPSNVLQAANFYQPTGIVRGRTQVRPADPARTRVIGNFEFDYTQHPIACTGYPWYALAFERSHIEIECDPAVTTQVESLIRSALLADRTNP